MKFSKDRIANELTLHVFDRISGPDYPVSTLLNPIPSNKMAAATEKKEAKKEMTKAEIVSALAESTQMTKTEVSTVLAELGNLIGKNVSKKGPGVFTLPGLLKIEVKVKPATKKRMGVNPRTGEPMEISAKPKMRVVRVRPLKGLKDMI